jgi:Domain of unknown function (DUF4437)
MHKSTSTLVLLLAGCATVATVCAVPLGAAFAQDMRPPINADEVKWGPAPPNIPAGAQIAVLAGDPSSDGPYVVRLKMPANYKVPAHYHPKDETVTVISGDFHVGMGDKLDMQKGLVLNAGGFGAVPAGMRHYGWTDGGTVVQIHGNGPFAITYVNPADDPSKGMTKASD